MDPRKLLVGAFATCLVAVGVASQTGTVRWPTFSESPSGGVHAQQASGTPSPSIEPSSSPSPQPTQAPAPPPPPPPAPPAHKKHGDH
ncbi:MAG TPA: hypothetical protein VKE27_09620 [Candidatus Dormibacteraeota bacterium]|nr:hypothetical protein [Candidatus Dormibacteraeota bacterium]